MPIDRRASSLESPAAIAAEIPERTAPALGNSLATVGGKRICAFAECEQQVFGIDVIVPELARRADGRVDHPERLFSTPVEHVTRPPATAYVMLVVHRLPRDSQ